MNVKDIRRENLRILAASVGGVTALSKVLSKSQSQISHIIGAHPIKNIGDRLAAHIEKVFDKPYGWLDKEHFAIAEARDSHYEPLPNLKGLQWVAIIKWDEISSWKQHIAKTDDNVPIKTESHKPFFALRIQNDFLGKLSGTQKLPSQEILIVNPYAIPTHEALVIAQMKDQPPAVMQFARESQQANLRTLEGTISQGTLQDHKIYGVVSQILWVFAQDEKSL